MGAAKQGHNKASKKVKQDAFLKKEWRHVMIPGYFTSKRSIGYTVSTKTARGKVPMDYLQGRNWELSHGDFAGEQTHAFRLFKWRTIAAADDVYTQFNGMRLTRDKMGSLLRKYRTLVNAEVDCRTADGYIVRLFSLCFTKKLQNSTKRHCYATQATCRKIREEMVKGMKEAATSSNVEALCKAVVEEKIETAILEACKPFCQIEGLFITKIKVIKAPGLTADQIKDLHIPKEVAEKSIVTEVARPTEQ